MKKVIATTAAPAAIGPYSQAIEHNGTLYLSGMLGIDPATGALVGATAAEQAAQALQNIEALLAHEGLTMQHIVKTTVFLTDLAEFAAVNGVYGGFFPAEPPARSCFQVSALPKGGFVEIECIACR